MLVLSCCVDKKNQPASSLLV